MNPDEFTQTNSFDAESETPALTVELLCQAYENLMGLRRTLDSVEDARRRYERNAQEFLRVRVVMGKIGGPQDGAA